MKERIDTLNKKPVFFIMISVLIICIVVAALFMRTILSVEKGSGGGASDTVLTQPPELFVGDLLSSQFNAGTYAYQLGYEWNYSEDGNDWSSTVVDSISPYDPEILSCASSVTIYAGKPSPYSLSWDSAPSQVYISRYDVDEIRNRQADVKNGIDITDSFSLVEIEADSLYVIHAVWDESSYKGTADYCIISANAASADADTLLLVKRKSFV